jgi:hypothetical protein
LPSGVICMQIPSPDQIRPLAWRSDLTAARSGVILLSWLILGAFGLNALSQRRILICAYQAAQPRCQLSAQRLIGSAEAVPFGQLKTAVFDQRRGSKGATLSQVTLETDQGRFWLTSNDSEGYASKSQIVETINQFLAQPRSDVLRIDPGQSGLFWIGSGIFGSLSLLFAAGTGLSIYWWCDRQRPELPDRAAPKI